MTRMIGTGKVVALMITDFSMAAACTTESRWYFWVSFVWRRDWWGHVNRLDGGIYFWLFRLNWVWPWRGRFNSYVFAFGLFMVMGLDFFGFHNNEFRCGLFGLVGWLWKLTRFKLLFLFVFTTRFGGRFGCVVRISGMRILGMFRVRVIRIGVKVKVNRVKLLLILNDGARKWYSLIGLGNFGHF